jgi:hypothetical protein
MKLLSAFFCVLLSSVGAHGQDHPRVKPAPTINSAATPRGSVAVLVGAGDIASCDDLAGAQATAKLLENIPGTVFAAGDLAYPDGSDEQFANCYGPTWGRFKDRTALLPETTNTTGKAHPLIYAISARLLAIRIEVFTATISVIGTSLS